MELAATDHRMLEHPHHRGAQRFAAVDADEDRPGRVQTAIPQPGQQVGDHASVLCAALCQPERMLGAIDPDPERHHAQVITEVHPVDHQRDQVQPGQVGGEQAFLATLVRNDAEDKKLRRSAAHAIGESKERGAVDLLRGLYDSVKDVEVRRSIISAASHSVHEKQQAFTFLLAVAKNDADAETRRVAVRRLGDFGREDAIDELMKIYAADPQLDVKRTALRALAETKSPRAQARVMEVARADANPEMRRQAIRVLGQRGEAAVDDLFKLFDSEQVPDVKRAVLQSLSEIKSTRVEDNLF